MFIAAIFIISKNWKNEGVLQKQMDKQTMVHLYRGTPSSDKEQWAAKSRLDG